MSFGRPPPFELSWILPGWEDSEWGQCGKTEGRGRGASLLQGSCNFHSRVLIKLVPRPLLRLKTPPHPLALQSGGSLYLFKPPLHLCNPHWEGDGALLVCLRGWVSSDLSNHWYSTNKSLFWLLKNIDYRCGYGVYFFYAYRSRMSISSLYHFQNHQIKRVKTINIANMVIFIFCCDLIRYRKSWRASLFSKASSNGSHKGAMVYRLYWIVYCHHTLCFCLSLSTGLSQQYEWTLYI